MKEPIELDNGHFEYEGVKYYLDVRIAYKIGATEDQISLSMNHIEDLEMGVALNRLHSDGFIIYDDPVGDIAKVLDVFEARCVVNFTAFKEQRSGDFGDWVLDKDNQLTHAFIVDNIEIVSNTESSVKYCIYLVGAEYENLLNNARFNNYGGEKNRHLVDIVKEILVSSGGCEVDETFATASGGIAMDYVSSGNDSVQTALDYVLQKQFFYMDKVDTSMKFLTYDLLTGKYGIFQMGSTPSGNTYTFVLSMNNTTIGSFVSKGGVQLASNVKFRKTDALIPISDIHMRRYDPATNTFVASSPVKSSELTRFFGGDRLVPQENAGKRNIVREASEWDNDFNIYKDFVDLFMKCDSVILNAGGVISRKLMSTVLIKADNMVDPNSTTTKDAKKDMERYKQLQGAWYVTKIQYIIKANRGVFKQNLTLSRNTNVQ